MEKRCRRQGRCRQRRCKDQLLNPAGMNAGCQYTAGRDLSCCSRPTRESGIGLPTSPGVQPAGLFFRRSPGSGTPASRAWLSRLRIDWEPFRHFPQLIRRTNVQCASDFRRRRFHDNAIGVRPLRFSWPKILPMLACSAVFRGAISTGPCIEGIAVSYRTER
jgi:hypothetical protein